MLNQSGAQFCGCDDYLHDRISQSKLAAILFIFFFSYSGNVAGWIRRGGRLFPKKKKLPKSTYAV